MDEKSDGWVWGGSDGSEKGVISFQKLFGLCGLNGHIVENW